ncbi:MAG: TRAP transporter small permease subunit [Burkholderiales bacterium]|nr:TRAP transporter small permease subunit [Burkholderiales bacterium]
MFDRIVYTIDQLSKSVGHAFAWCIVILTLGTSYEVFMRYLLNSPTTWAFDMSYILYGGLFLMAGPYALSRNAHVRGDVIFRLWPQRTQGWIELVLYFLFFFPGVVSFMFAGWHYAYDAFALREVSVNSPVGVPVWPLKMLIPVAGALLTLQGIAEVIRCVQCIRTGQWPARLHDVEELESAIAAEEADRRRREAAERRAAEGGR